MKRRLVVEFTKMNGAGNDFIVIDNRFYHFSDEELSELAVRLCRRRFGIGADGLLAFANPTRQGSDFRMRYVNADGSLGTMCGNGARCLVRFARRAGLTGAELSFETDAGLVRAQAVGDDAEPVRLYMNLPADFEPNRRLESVSSTTVADAHYVWTGTEHLVCFVDRLRDVPVFDWGRRIRGDSGLAPAGANVDFVELGDGRSPRLVARTYEKGVEDETLACGTGAVAAAVVARLLGRVDGDRIEVEMRGGTLVVGVTLADGNVTELFLEGPAEAVFRGTVEV